MGDSFRSWCVSEPDTPVDAPMAATELRLWRRLRIVQELPDKDRRAVLHFIDSLVTRHQLEGDRE